MKKKNTIWYYISNYKFSSLFFKNFIIIFTVLYLPLAAICMGGYVYFQKTLFGEVTASMVSSVQRIREIVDTVQDNVESTAANLALDNSVNQFVLTEEWDIPNYELSQNIRDIIKTISLTNGEYVDSIYVYSKKNQYLLSNIRSSAADVFYDMEWLSRYPENTEYPMLSTWGRTSENEEGKPASYITTAYAIPYDSTRNSQGVVLINMGCGWLDQLVKPNSLADGGDFFIVDEGGKILYSSGRSYIEEDFKTTVGYPLSESYHVVSSGEGGKETKLVTNSKSAKSGWSYISVHPMTDYQTQMNLLKTVVLLLLFLLLLLAVAVSYFVSAKVFLPIKNIIQMMDDPKKFYDKSTVFQQSKQHNEIRYITATFLNTITKTEQAEKELIHYITKLKKTQAALLQAQINPHFLYNTLQTINFMAISLTKSDNQVSKAIGMLSSMFTQMMHVDSNTVSIEDEITYCKAYLELELLRHGYEFDVDWQLDETVLDYITVKLTLQPVLENAIKHGLNNTGQKGKIRVSAYATENAIVFSVSDNGTGKDCQWIEEINQELQELELLIGDHIGIRNVHQRIRLIFGNEYGLSFCAGDLGGVEVKIVIPKVKKQP